MHPLDNAIWSALTTRQGHLGHGNQAAAKFASEVSILGGFAEPTSGYPALAQLMAPGERVGLFVTAARPAPGFEQVSSSPVVQMVRERDTPLGGLVAGVEPLGPADVTEMYALAQLAKPGPFNARTPEMGEFVGVRRDGQLVAMAGQRLRVPGYIELSAICTHPEHAGHGYAAVLMAVLVGRIVAAGERPVLHVRGDNVRAIALYERLGFTRRLETRYVVLVRNDEPAW